MTDQKDKEASDIIEEALNKAVSKLDGYQEGDFIGDWIVVGYSSNPDTEKGGAYPMLFSNGNMPDYRAKGLLSTAMLYLDAGLVKSHYEPDED